MSCFSVPDHSVADEMPSAITDNCPSLDSSFLTYGLHRHAGGEGKDGQVNVPCDIPERKQSNEWYQMRAANDQNGLSFNCTCLLKK